MRERADLSREKDMGMTIELANRILSEDPRQILVRGWNLDGAGPARYGWWFRHACKVEYLGHTLSEVLDRAVEIGGAK